MPNRLIKESICTSEEIDSLTPEQEVFFYRLMVNCDDYGLFHGNPKIVASKCYPLKSIDINCIQMMLSALVKVGLISMYEVNGKSYIAISKWSEHQQIRAKKAKYPLPNDGKLISLDINCNQLQAFAPVIQSNPIQIESESESNTSKLKPDGFELFWSAYPKKKNKGQAEKAWKKLKPDTDLVAKMLAAIAIAKQSPSWMKDGGQFIPYPASWLSSKGWEDSHEVEGVTGYSDEALRLIDAYNEVLGAADWPEASTDPFIPEREASIKEFLTFSTKDDWVASYLAWMRDNLEAKPGCGFDWLIKRETFVRAKEGNFSRMREAA